jgi:NAD(P)-dependent dehydrogenase (short-subunit alcohol dehydrogenase family)
MDLELKGKKALVTGGTRGIGLAIAERLAMEGADIALCARDAARVQDCVAQIAAKGVRATGRAVDVADHAALRSWIEDAADEFGGLDIVVANVTGGGGASDAAAWKANFDIDMLGTVVTIEAALPALRASRGSVLVISSTAAIESFLGPLPYNAMKAALINYAKNLSNVLAQDGIRVNTITPGPTYSKDGSWSRIETENPDFYEMIRSTSVLGRLGRAEEVAAAAAFLCSPLVEIITGANLVIDGGFTRRIPF